MTSPATDLSAALPRRTQQAVTCATAGAAVTAALGLAHVLEIPGKHKLDAGQFLAVHHNFYGGYAVVGGLGETIGFVGLLSAGLWTRPSHPRESRLSLWGAGALGFALGLFFLGLAPLNGKIAGWTPQTIAPDWRSVRDRWEFFHVMNLGLALSAFGLCMRVLRAGGSPRPAGSAGFTSQLDAAPGRRQRTQLQAASDLQPHSPSDEQSCQ